MQEDQIPPSRDLHAFDVGRAYFGSAVSPPFPKLGLGTSAVSASMGQPISRDDSRNVSSGQVNVTCVGFSAMFNPSSLLFPLFDSGFSSFPPPASSSLGVSSSSSLGLSTVAPSSLPVFSLPSVVPTVLAVFSSAPPLSLLLLLWAFLPRRPFPLGFLPLFLLCLLPLLHCSLLLLLLLLTRCLPFFLIRLRLPPFPPLFPLVRPLPLLSPPLGILLRLRRRC